jgi:hypothetical protein
MNKMIRSAITLLLNASKKTASSRHPRLGYAAKRTADKVNAWLDKQRSVIAENDAAVQALQHNLDFSRLRFEQLSRYEQFIIIPLNEGFETINNKDKSPVNNLVLITDEMDRIREGNIVQYIPGDKDAGIIPPGTFFNLFNDKTIDCSGQFTFLTIAGRYLYEMNYENGAVHSFRLMRSGAAVGLAHTGPGNEPVTGDPGLDWYLVTTLYHTNGGIEIFEDHLGACYDGCRPDAPAIRQALYDDEPEAIAPVKIRSIYPEDMGAHCWYRPAVSS